MGFEEAAWWRVAVREVIVGWASEGDVWVQGWWWWRICAVRLLG